MWEFWIQFGLIGGLLVMGFSVGAITERRHLASLTRREADYTQFPVTNLKRITQPETVREASLVMGDAVIATDYFKSFAARLRNIVGGEVKTFDKLLKRARREALLRLLDDARAIGATEVWNVRFETSNIASASNKNPAVSVEIFAFGTAVRRA